MHIFAGGVIFVVMIYGEGAFDSYRAALAAVGQESAVSLDPAMARRCGGLLLPGGGDIFGALGRRETAVINAFVARRRPILGICRGMQALNVYFGGTLFQDLPSQHPHGIDHHMTPPYDRAVHTVSLVPGTPLQTALKKDELGVNSYHHQAIRRLAPRLEVMAIAEDGIIESVYLPDYRFVWGMQWHPELNFQKDASSRRIFGAFASACKASRRCRERSASGKRREALPA